MRVLSKLSLLEKSKDCWFIVLSVIVFIILRTPSLIEPYWYGDEGIYEVLGMAVRNGRLLYKEIWDNKPPVLYLIYSVFDGDQFWVRLLSLLFGVLATLSFFFLSAKLLRSRVAIYVSTFLFAILFGLPLLEGNIANAENFMLLPIIVAGLLLLSSQKNYVFAGLLLSFAFLTKIVGIFDFSAFLVFLFVVKFYDDMSYIGIVRFLSRSLQQGKIITAFKNELLFIVSFFIPILASILFFFWRGALFDYYTAVFSQNVGYVGYGNYFLFPLGFLMVKLLFVFIALILILRYRKLLGTSGVFIYIWFLFSIFNALFSERPYTHYLLVLLPSFCLLLGYLFEKRTMVYPHVAALLIMGFIISKNFYLYEKVISYYINYVDVVRGVKNISSYQAFFDRNTPRDYAIVDFINLHTTKDESVFLWSDSAQIYALSHKLPPGRYTVSYHVTFYKNAIAETYEAIAAKKTKYIIVIKNTPEVVQLLQHYRLKYNIKDAKIYERET